jgi:hypothetical protein
VVWARRRPSGEELARLRRAVRDLEQPNTILKAAAARFARELDPQHRGSDDGQRLTDAEIDGARTVFGTGWM